MKKLPNEPVAQKHLCDRINIYLTESYLNNEFNQHKVSSLPISSFQG